MSLITIGLISDTHGLLRPQALQALAGCQVILHAGDVGSPQILTDLARLAPVHAVRGNMDGGDWGRQLPPTDIIDIGGHLFYLLHNLQHLDLDPVAAGLTAVISGHSHQPHILNRQGVLYVNPGSAGPRRFSYPITVAQITISPGPPAATIIPLEIA